MLFGRDDVVLQTVLMHILQPEAWTVTFSVLQATETSPESKLFAATTLKGKV